MKATIWYYDWDNRDLDIIFGIKTPASVAHHEQVDEIEVGDDAHELVLERLFRLYNVVDGNERPTVLGIRSMAVGDIVEFDDGTTYACRNYGWEKIETPSS